MTSSLGSHANIGFVIQARLGSSRLPGKALLYFGGTTVLGYLINSLLDNGVADTHLCVATSDSPSDDVLSSYVADLGLSSVRGSESNVLERFQNVADATDFDHLVRLTGDNPIVDPLLINYCIERHLASNVALTSTRLIQDEEIIRYVPKGLSVDVMRTAELLSIDTLTCSPYEQEHVIPFFFKKFDFHVVKDYETYVRTHSIDTLQDYTDALVLQKKLISNELA